jgi:hypothetical protein
MAWKNPTGRLTDSGCVVIDIRKLSNNSVASPGNDAMDRYKINYKGRSYQLVDENGELKLKEVVIVKIAPKKKKA